MPLAEGRLTDVSRLVVVADGPRPTDARVLESWPDGSVRWALVDTDAAVPADGLTLEVRDDLPRPALSGLNLTVDTRTAVVADGRLRFAIDCGAASLVTACTWDGRSALAFPTAPVVVADDNGTPATITFSRIEVEHGGRLRVVLRVEGEARWADGRRLAVRLRFTLYAGRPVVGIELGLHNPRKAEHPGGFWELGDAGSVLLRSAAFVCATPTTPVAMRLATAAHGVPAPIAAPMTLTQHASGGANWQSRVHVDRHGVVPMAAPGFVLEAGDARQDGDRATPALTITHDAGACALVARRFWEVFPKAIGAAADGAITVWSLPAGTGPHEIQGGERCDFAFACVLAPDADAEVWCTSPSTALPALDAVAAAEQMPALDVARPGVNDAYERLVDAAVDGDDTFLAKRDRIDEYGWRHFGDLYADHENGTTGLLRVSHYNNQYDALAGLALQALRHDDHRWWGIALDLARHLTRIDIYWTDEDRAAYNGGLFWHTAHYTDAGTSTHRTYPGKAGLPGGGPANEHCYSHGLLLHYYLTGDAVSREAAIGLADWVIAMDDGRRARWPMPWLSTAPTGAASSTASEDYHGPGRGAGNAIVTLLNAHRLTGETRYLEYGEGLIRRVIHPDDDLVARDLLNVEGRWSYTVCLQALGRYLALREGRGGAVDYARASLLHYATWMAAHEYFYLDKPEVLEFPTETWAAQELRKAEVLDVAAYHAPTAEIRARCLERARYFHDRGIETLTASPLRTRTRPVVLLLSNGYARAWFERAVAAAPLAPRPVASWPAPVPFEPQKRVAMRRLKLAAAAAGAVGLAGAAMIVRWFLA